MNNSTLFEGKTLKKLWLLFDKRTNLDMRWTTCLTFYCHFDFSKSNIYPCEKYHVIPFKDVEANPKLYPFKLE